MTPIFKIGGREKAGNYRPVSLTSVVGKLLDSIIEGITARYLENLHPIRQSQHGFVKEKSCLELLEGVTSNVDKGEPVDVLYLDFWEGFDKVPHQRLQREIRAHVVGVTVLYE